jgi:cobalt-zinc-cadmium resistance protein CzcA
VPPLVDVITQNPGQSAEEIERYITIPLVGEVVGELDLHVRQAEDRDRPRHLGVRDAGELHKVTRTISVFGLSDVKIQFTYDFTYQEALQRVLNRRSISSADWPGFWVMTSTSGGTGSG